MKTQIVKIVSDGTPLGTKVYDSNRNEIINIKSISINIDAGKKQNTVIMEVVGVELKTIERIDFKGIISDNDLIAIQPILGETATEFLQKVFPNSYYTSDAEQKEGN